MKKKEVQTQKVKKTEASAKYEYNNSKTERSSIIKATERCSSTSGKKGTRPGKK